MARAPDGERRNFSGEWEGDVPIERSSLLPAEELLRLRCNDPLPEKGDPEDPCPQPPSYCTGCSVYRLSMSPMIGVVVGLTGLTYYAYVFETPDASVVELALFHLLILLMLVSYFQCVAIDPGTVPKRWHDAVIRSPLRSRYRICRKCHMYKPPRSHFDSITRRLVLNMDHFCPWVVNCVGFYNRKFFILFLFYVVLSCLDFVLAMLIHGPLSVQGLLINSNGFPSPLKFMAFIFDCSLAFAVTLFFLFHLRFVYYNQTTIEADDRRYDVGWRKNFESVFGRNPWLWALPVYGSGPVGDGVHWEIAPGQEVELDVEAGEKGNGDEDERRHAGDGQENLSDGDSD
uniref:Palmitoyltransferase n=1 Tax=Guillardia theta TaxID=55529 RepID=A0A7S4P7B2_GUITH|mmetsp:Transcript_44609/g.140787  ORF Transcript_44609/g.140787 Transcript_44609/m.140787 type:complete len:344 (+) Transcript_44609:55-1086(+)